MTTVQMRVYVLARELDQPTGVVLSTARRLGFDVKNSLSSLTAEQQRAVEKVLKRWPPNDPSLGVTSKLRPRGPQPKAASQRLMPPSEDQED
jgi:hypothetical protein